MILKKKESERTKDQKKLQALRIQKKIEDSKAQQCYTKKLLQSCKSWNGPATTPDELEDIWSKHASIEEK